MCVWVYMYLCGVILFFSRYAQPLAVIDMWKKFEVDNGAEILEVYISLY